MSRRLSGMLMAFCAPVWAGQLPARAGSATVLKPAPAPASELQQFKVRGTIRTHRPGSTLAVIAHEEIPGYMEAMTMPLVARQAAELKDLKPGDRIVFRLNVTDDDCWIDEVGITEPSTSPEPVAQPPGLSAIAPGQPFPSFSLTDHLGRPLTPDHYRGRAFAVTFIYTNCPLPTFCPRINRHFQEVQQIIQSHPSSTARLLSVTIDPARDTPEHLAGFAASWKADPERWRFATGTLEEITALSLRCGLSFWDQDGLVQHNLRTIVVNARGEVHEVLTDGDWTPGQLAAALEKASVEFTETSK